MVSPSFAKKMASDGGQFGLSVGGGVGGVGRLDGGSVGELVGDLLGGSVGTVG